MLLAKAFTVQVEPVKQTSTLVTTERPFISPVQSACTSSVQTTSVVTQVSSSKPLTSASSVRAAGLVTQPASVSQPTDVPSMMCVLSNPPDRSILSRMSPVPQLVQMCSSPDRFVRLSLARRTRLHLPEF